MGEGGGGRRERKLSPSFASIFPFFPRNERLILRLFVWFVCLFPRGWGHPNIGVIVTEVA